MAFRAPAALHLGAGAHERTALALVGHQLHLHQEALLRQALRTYHMHPALETSLQGLESLDFELFQGLFKAKS